MTSPSILPEGPIVVGVGEKPQSLVAVRLAAREATTHGRPLLALHAFNWLAQSVLPPDGGPGPRVKAEQVLAGAIDAAHEVAPELEVTGEIAEGPAVASLVRRSANAMMVIIGDGGMTHGNCVPQDDSALQLAARAYCPVLVVRSDPPPTGPVLAGIDSSATATSVLDVAFEYAGRRDAALLVVRVVGESSREQPDDPVARHRQRHPAVPVEYRRIVGDPPDILNGLARGTELVVVGARGDEPWRGMLGEVSQSLLYHAPAPVLVVRGLTGREPRRP